MEISSFLLVALLHTPLLFKVLLIVTVREAFKFLDVAPGVIFVG